MKLVFMGTPEFAGAILTSLVASDHEIMAVVTGRDKPVGRRQSVQPTAVRLIAEQHQLEVIMPPSLKDESLLERLQDLAADLFVVAAFRILPPKLFELPPLGSINIHASLLPQYRGAAPINWAIAAGEKETGLTSFQLRKSIDTGDMIDQEKVTIATKDTYDSLYERLAEQAGPFTLKTLDLIASGDHQPVPQNDALASPAPKIQPGDALINFDQAAEKVAAFIRGMATRPGAYTHFRGQKLKVHFAAVEPEEADRGQAPGTIIKHRKKLLVQCRPGVVELTLVVPAGKKEMAGGSFVNGFRPEAGESFLKNYRDMEKL